MEEIPVQKIDVIFNEDNNTFEFWQMYEAFDSKHLIMAMTIDDVIQELRNSVVKSLVLLGGVVQQ